MDSDCKFANFIDGGLDAEAKTDPTGHGTAVAVQILRVSLKAVLYICRVMSPNSGPDKSAIEKAIRKAAAKPDKSSPDGGGWGVDIINMSFGWPYHHERVRKAIDFARQNGVHLFAATSNDGLLGPPNDILYPARSESVIAVDAADGYGEHAKSAPSSTSQHSRGSRFSAPGLGITSPNSKDILEGSSFACPIVAGVVALILEFARQSPLNKSLSVQACLQEMPAMLALLRSASSEKGPDGLKFLTPWKLIGVEALSHPSSSSLISSHSGPATTALPAGLRGVLWAQLELGDRVRVLCSSLSADSPSSAMDPMGW
ncbi:subtilisin [Fusarium agapanthi]|uniref:Subtilisin n=1 Tax=Fusarium agapanthi TaxID=1803897 RepID=A0A9P5BC51_9HYPO|nr:subtilisin [Fusarium agapanthi]